ncbi:MAG: zinc ABC transporter substrate-binding protein [Rhodospirillaceae bacterium]
MSAWTPAAVDAAKPRVVASIPPLHSLAVSLLAGIAEPALILSGGASPHGYALKPSEARTLARADVVLWIGPELEGFLVRPLANLPEGATVLRLGAAPGLTRRPVRARRADGGGLDHDHGHDQGHKHGRAATDPHLWLDPGNARAMARAMADALARRDPARTDIYRRNLARLDDRLGRLETDMTARLQPVRERRFVVFHDAYQYLEARFGLQSAGAVAIDADRPPGAAHVRALKRTLEAGGVACLFTEPQFPPKLAKTLSEGTGVRLAVLDPMGNGIKPGLDQYFVMMRANADALFRCLSR